MRCLITGAGGQIGRELAEHLSARDDDVIPLTHAQLDVYDRNAVHQAIAAHQPDVVVHTAAWTAVDACEGDPARAHAVNGSGARFIAEACATADAHLVHLSTDYVFDGTKPTPYVETDDTNPICVYGESKLAAEVAVADVLDERAAIIRTSWVCGRYGSNMVKTLLGLASRPGRLSFVDDQVGHPTIVRDLVGALTQVADRRLAGLFHVTNQGAVSWYEFAREVLAAAGDEADRVVAIKTSALDPPRAAARPANSVLENAAWSTAGLPLLPHHHDAVVALVTELRAH